MRARLVDLATDYLVFANWWSDWQFPIIPPDHLPETGIIVEDDDFKSCAGWLYKMDAKICMVEWIISNIAAPKKARGAALHILIESLLTAAKENGFKTVFSSIKTPKLIQRFEQCGFVAGEKDMTNMIRRL